jgi:hypothetical protein
MSWKTNLHSFGRRFEILFYFLQFLSREWRVGGPWIRLVAWMVVWARSLLMLLGPTLSMAPMMMDDGTEAERWSAQDDQFNEEYWEPASHPPAMADHFENMSTDRMNRVFDQFENMSTDRMNRVFFHNSMMSVVQGCRSCRGKKVYLHKSLEQLILLDYQSKMIAHLYLAFLFSGLQ